MPKKSLTILLSTFLLSTAAFAQTSEEQITITAYYPSPYGVYRELRAQRQAVGETWYSNANVCWGTAASCPAGSTVIDESFSPMGADGVDLVVKGWVGVGIANPTGPLHVHSTDSQGFIMVSGASDAGNTYSAVYLEDDNPTWGVPVGSRFNSWYMGFSKALGSAEEGDFSIGYYNTAGTDTRHFNIERNGNVGIGTPSAGAKLHIVGDSSVASDRTLMYLDGGGASDAPLVFRATRGGTQPITNGLIEAVTIGGHGGGETVPHFYIAAFKDDSVTSANLIRLQLVGNPIALTDGNVGIGTTSPTKTLDVDGTVRIRQGGPAAGKFLKATNSNGDAVWDNPATSGSGGFYVNNWNPATGTYSGCAAGNPLKSGQCSCPTGYTAYAATGVMCGAASPNDWCIYYFCY